MEGRERSRISEGESPVSGRLVMVFCGIVVRKEKEKRSEGHFGAWRWLGSVLSSSNLTSSPFGGRKN